MTDDRANNVADFQKIRLAVDKGRNGEALPVLHGNFSEAFFKRVTAALDLAGSVAEHVAGQVSASGGAEDRVDGTREAPLPMSVQAFSDTNEIYALLVYWSRIFATELRVQAPGPAARAWRNDRGTIVGLPANLKPAEVRYLVGIMAKWLTIHLKQIMALDPEDVTAFESGDSGVKLIFTINARWPQRERPRYSEMHCPDDGCKGRIAVYPPREFGDDERIVCEGCGRHFLPDQYEHLVNVFLQIRADEARAAKVTAGLVAKYLATA